jgi:lipoprotein-releasing system ATP-binding protein
MIDIQKVSMAFGKRAILDDVNMTFNPGTITAITGKSGAGKTTLLGIISGLLNPDSGKVFFEGKNILRWGDFRRSRYRNKEIGFVFQFFNLLPDITSYQNIIYPALVSFFSKSKDLEKEVNELVEELHIGEILHNYPTTLSGGERQRVAIARAIINRPRIILADEPTGNLDDLSAKGILTLFKKLRDDANICFIIVTHDPRIVDLADTHYHLENARIVKKKDRAAAVSVKRSAGKTAPAKNKPEGTGKKRPVVSKKTAKRNR